MVAYWTEIGSRLACERMMEKRRSFVPLSPSVMLTSAAFSLLHQAQLAHAWAPLLILFWVGVALTVVRARTNSVATCVLVHMGYNGALFGLMFYFTEGFRHLERAV